MATDAPATLRYVAITSDGRRARFNVHERAADWHVSGRVCGEFVRISASSLDACLGRVTEVASRRWCAPVELLPAGEPTRAELLVERNALRAGIKALLVADAYITEEHNGTWCQHCGHTLTGAKLSAHLGGSRRVMHHKADCAWVAGKALLASPAVKRALANGGT